MKKLLTLITMGLVCSIVAAAQAEDNITGEATSGKPRYGNNIVSLVPVAFNNSGQNVGLAYERILDEKGKLSIYVPLLYSSRPLDWHYRYQYKSTTIGGLLGFKFYPTSSRGVVRYAMGLSIGSYAITRTYEKGWSPGGLFDQKNKEHYLKTGLLFNNSISFTLAGKVSLALDLHLGVADSDEPDYDSTEPFVLLMFKAGYRF